VTDALFYKLLNIHCGSINRHSRQAIASHPLQLSQTSGPPSFQSRLQTSLLLAVLCYLSRSHRWTPRMHVAAMPSVHCLKHVHFCHVRDETWGHCNIPVWWETFILCSSDTVQSTCGWVKLRTNTKRNMHLKISLHTVCLKGLCPELRTPIVRV
jgi:hypothetical protein